jgi:hypothetical protein
MLLIANKKRNLETKSPTGCSHFNYLRDNLLLSWMHSRLFMGFLLRLPWLIARRIKGV